MITDTTQTTAPAAPQVDDFTKALQQKLMDSSNMISSSNTNLDNAISGIIGNYKDANTAADARTSSQYDRQIGYQQDQNNAQLTNYRETTPGGSNTATTAYQFMSNQADKQIKDLQDRKQEALLANDQATYSKIADLQTASLKMKNDAMQQTFTNLLGMANFNTTAQAGARAQQAQDFTQQSTISQIALKYGVTVNPGDTLATITSRVAPLATAEEKASLAKDLATANELNARAQYYAAGNASDAKLATDVNSPTGLAGIVKAWELAGGKNSAVDQQISKNTNVAAKVYPAIEKSQNEVVDGLIQQAKTQGLTQEQLKQNIDNAVPNKVNVPAIVQKIASYTQPSTTKQHGFSSDVQSIFDASYNAGYSVGTYLKN